MPTIGIATNKKILELFKMMKEESLILAPSFQRKLVWNDRHKESFIDTILKGLPFPEIYLADGDIDLVSQMSKTLVVDGQQRMSTIYQYIDDSEDFKLKKITPFAELTAAEQTAFYDYIVVVRDLGRIENDEIIEIFKRINSVQYALKAMEIRNALYEGEYIFTAKEIAEKNSSFKHFEIFSDTQYSRMQDIEFILLIMSTIEEKGYFTGSKEIEKYVKKYDTEYINKKSMLSDINSVFKLIHQSISRPDSIWASKSNYFTLAVELLKFKKNNDSLMKSKPLSDVLEKFELELFKAKAKNPEKNDFALYYKFIFQATASRKGRNTRGSILRNHLDILK